MKPKVVLYHPVPKTLLDELYSRFDLTVFDSVTDANKPEFIAAAKEADGLIGMGLPIDTADLTGSKRLRVIATISTGFDKFDIPLLTANKIVLMNLYDPLTDTTADLAFALILASGRRLVELDRKVRRGEWIKSVETPWFGLDVHGKTLGIVGMGRIGAAIARRGNLGCGMPILYTARNPKPDVEQQYGARHCELDELLRESDYVCVVVPLTSETTRLIGERELKLMKPTAIFVNVARGPVVDQAALIEALEDGTIYGAGLDVYDPEPLPLDSPLLTLDNVVLAPHIGSATIQTRDGMALYAGESLIGYLCRGEARNVVNPEALPQ
jgi:gluconate 2-dehydrogenase